MLGGVADHDPIAFAKYVEHSLKTNAAQCTGWRSVSLNAWSAPKDHGSMPYGQTQILRKEWIIWDYVRKTAAFQLDYSDMGHIHPSLEEVPGYVMANATVSVRYTIDDKWLNIKGKSTSGPHGIPMSTQYQSHAKALTKTTGFGGIPNCWGDGRIAHYATSTSGSGGRPQWAAILMNRHISVIAQNLP